LWLAFHAFEEVSVPMNKFQQRLQTLRADPRSLDS
jgi:hypothetical protein